MAELRQLALFSCTSKKHFCLQQGQSTVKLFYYNIKRSEQLGRFSPLKKAEKLKQSGNFKIYTIAIGKGYIGWNSLRHIASGTKHFFAVSGFESVEDIVKMAIEKSLSVMCFNNALRDTWE